MDKKGLKGGFMWEGRGMWPRRETVGVGKKGWEKGGWRVRGGGLRNG